MGAPWSLSGEGCVEDQTAVHLANEAILGEPAHCVECVIPHERSGIMVGLAFGAAAPNRQVGAAPPRLGRAGFGANRICSRFWTSRDLLGSRQR